MHRRIGRALQVGIFVAVLGACGGGGDEGGGSVVDVTPLSLTFTARQGGPLPAAQAVRVHQKDLSLVYGSHLEGDQTWVRETTFAMIDTSQPDFSHVFAATTTDLPPGRYTASYQIVIHQPGPPYSGTGPYIPGPLVEQKTVLMTYVVSAP